MINLLIINWSPLLVEYLVDFSKTCGIFVVAKSKTFEAHTSYVLVDETAVQSVRGKH